VIQKGKLLGLDLGNPEVGKRMAKATNDNEIRKIFDDLGGNY
jgi:hypothetical protein